MGGLHSAGERFLFNDLADPEILACLGNFDCDAITDGCVGDEHDIAGPDPGDAIILFARALANPRIHSKRFAVAKHVAQEHYEKGS